MITISAEAPRPEDQIRIAGLAQSLNISLKAGRRSADSLRTASIKARLQAMKLAPIPADPRHAVERAREAARLAKEAGGGDAAEEVEARRMAAEARHLAAQVVARARKALDPGSPEDQALRRLQAALGGAGGEAIMDLSV